MGPGCDWAGGKQRSSPHRGDHRDREREDETETHHVRVGSPQDGHCAGKPEVGNAVLGLHRRGHRHHSGRGRWDRGSMSQLRGLSGGGRRSAKVSNRVSIRTRCGLQKGQESNRSTADDHHDLPLIQIRTPPENEPHAFAGTVGNPRSERPTPPPEERTGTWGTRSRHSSGPILPPRTSSSIPPPGK